jgi:hypothetical protein
VQREVEAAVTRVIKDIGKFSAMLSGHKEDPADYWKKDAIV